MARCHIVPRHSRESCYSMTGFPERKTRRWPCFGLSVFIYTFAQIMSQATGLTRASGVSFATPHTHRFSNQRLQTPASLDISMLQLKPLKLEAEFQCRSLPTPHSLLPTVSSKRLLNRILWGKLLGTSPSLLTEGKPSPPPLPIPKP